MSSYRGGVPHGKCRSCGNMRGLYTTGKLCHACNAKRKAGDLELRPDGTWRDMELLRTAGKPGPCFPAAADHAAVPDEQSQGGNRRSRKRVHDRGFVDFSVTAAGESLGLGHCEDENFFDRSAGARGRYAAVDA